MVMHQNKIDYNKHRQTTFGAYVQALIDTNKTNSQYLRTVHNIHLK